MGIGANFIETSSRRELLVPFAANCIETSFVNLAAKSCFDASLLSAFYGAAVLFVFVISWLAVDGVCHSRDQKAPLAALSVSEGA